MFSTIKSLSERIFPNSKRSVRSIPARQRKRMYLCIESLEDRHMLSGTPITGLQVIEQGVQPSTLVSITSALSPIEAVINSASVRNAIISNAEQQIMSSTNSKLPGGFSVSSLPTVNLPLLSSANTSLTDVINSDGSVSLDMQITGVTGSVTVNLSSAVQWGIFAALGGPLSPPAYVAFSGNPTFSFSADIDLQINVPNPLSLVNSWDAHPSLTSFALPASDMKMTADNIQVSGKNALASIALVFGPVKSAATANQTLTISPTVASDVNLLVAGLAENLTTAYNDGALVASDYQVANKSGILTYTVKTTQTIYLVQNSLTPNIPKVSGSYAPVTAKATYYINGQDAQSVPGYTNPTYALTTASAPGKHQITMEIDVQNISVPVLLYNATPVQVGSGWDVKFNTGGTAPLTQSNGDWAFTWPDGVKCVTGFSTSKPPNDYLWPLLTRFKTAPPGTQLGVRKIFLTFDTKSDTLTATTSDGLKFNFTGDLWEPITIPASNGYPAITFTVGLNFL